MINVLIVDDSFVSQKALEHALSTSPDIRIAAKVSDGAQALDALTRNQVDIVTMDLFLRHENGLSVTKQIMETQATPVLIVTSADTSDPSLIYEAMQSGALEVVPKPPSLKNPSYDKYCRKITRLVRTLSGVPVVHHIAPGSARNRRPRLDSDDSGLLTPRGASRVGVPSCRHTRFDALILGASTGGPPLVARILESIPKDFPLPIVLLQHMASGFISSFAKWLEDVTAHRICVVEESATLEPAVVYLPGENRHFVFATPTRVRTTMRSEDEFNCPSIDETFKSAARVLGSRALAVIMTGMGRDGAAGLAQMKASGAVTVAQEPSTCLIDSMPKNAIEHKGARHVLSPDEIARFIARTV